jgi:arylsulfatase
VLIVVDTLRADRLGYAGHAAARTPHFDSLQRESVWFTRAYTTSAWTIPAIGSLLLSQLPSRHGLIRWGSRMSTDETTLVELLKQNGYHTGAWTANRLMGRSRGFSQGFDEYRMVLHPKKRAGTKPGTEFAIAPAHEVTSRALSWIAKQRAEAPGAALFVYVHYLEPHGPYLCAEGSHASCRREAAELNHRLFFGPWEFDEHQRRRIRELYDDDVARMDDALGVLLRGLTKHGLMAKGWVILVADHGEDLGEAGAWNHGMTLNQRAVHSPLLLRPPAGGKAVVDVPVSLLDLAPTILDLAGLEIPPEFAGRSLRGASLGAALEPRKIVMELYPKSDDPARPIRHSRAVIDGQVSLLLSPEGRLERFDLTNDPGEQAPAEASLADLARLHSAGVVVERQPAAKSSGDHDIQPEMAEHLKALGYIQ